MTVSQLTLPTWGRSVFASPAKKRGWPPWATTLIAVAGLVVSFFAWQTSTQATRHARDSADAAKQVAEDTRAPVLDVVASYIRTPVPDYMKFVRALSGGTDSLQLTGDQRLFNSSGVWHVAITNNGDAVATDVRVRAPGIFFARHVSFATGTNRQFDHVENEEFDIGNLSPGQFASAVLWVLPDYTLADVCTPITTAAACFTKDQLIVFAENASGDEYVESFDPAMVARPEEVLPERGALSLWLVVIPLVVVAAGILIWFALRNTKGGQEPSPTL